MTDYLFLCRTYSVLASSVLRPNRDYSVIVSAHNTNGTLRLAVEVSGNVERGGVSGADSYLSRQEALLQPDTSQLIKFPVNNWVIYIVVWW